MARQGSAVRFLRGLSLKASVIPYSVQRVHEDARRGTPTGQTGLICLFVALSPIRVTGLDALLKCGVCGALLSGGGHDRLLAVTQISHRRLLLSSLSPRLVGRS